MDNGTRLGVQEVMKLRVERRGECAFLYELRKSRDEESGNFTDRHAPRSRGRL
jgi:hypothetical protein